jgi:hypothetical protein
MKGLISSKLLKIGYGLDKWLAIFPCLTGAGILVAFSLAVRDMMKLKKEWH